MQTDIIPLNDDIELEKELIDYEPDNATDTADSPSADATASGWPRGRHDPTRAATGNGAEPLRRTSRAIADALADIASGNASGEYPTVESIIRRQRQQPTTGTSDAPHRQAARQSFIATSRRQLIADIRPPMRERMAVAEHELDDFERDLNSVRETALQAMSRSDVYELARVLDERINNAHRRIDRDVLPAINEQRTRTTAKLVVTWAVLLISLAANIIAVYRYFNIKL